MGRLALEHECEANAGNSQREVQCFCSDFFDFAWKCWSITAVPTTVPTARQRKRTQSNTPKFQVLLFIVFHQMTKRKQYAPGKSEQERRRRWIAACRLESLNVTRHTRICSKHFEGICKVRAPVRMEVKRTRDWTIFCNQLLIYNIADSLSSVNSRASSWAFSVNSTKSSFFVGDRYSSSLQVFF